LIDDCGSIGAVWLTVEVVDDGTVFPGLPPGEVIVFEPLSGLGEAITLVGGWVLMEVVVHPDGYGTVEDVH
jgi:hypothetical protein